MDEFEGSLRVHEEKGLEGRNSSSKLRFHGLDWQENVMCAGCVFGARMLGLRRYQRSTRRTY